ncbi:HEAT repeat domain-containing protein [Streptomyces sp. YC504]|uniref:HEAT repeat domain-containing protein n=1 Tax=Streptomyces mesophilus TaxID=1775132 RepID=A0A6G4XD59_9ACTN|nr:HEAT repeat domain-containing protein [Streptomyces mesophilus]NGO75102.1 HEAT repeat domain-containing protein [Streptomyces mesophilus]
MAEQRLSEYVAGELSRTDWEVLGHAYGPAGDIPPYLAGLLDSDADRQSEALGMLDMAVLHQGSLYSATPPAALFVAAVLDHPRTLAEHESHYPWDERTRPLRAALIEWLGQIADCAAYGETTGGEDSNDPGVTAACRAVRPALYQSVQRYLSDPHPAIREAAVGTVTHLLRAPELAEHIPHAAGHLRHTLAHSPSRRERATCAVTLGLWGQDTTAYLDDPDPAVATCAALADRNAGEAKATALLLAALEHPAEADAWFRPHLPHFDGWFRFTLLRVALERTTLEELLPAALAMLRMSSHFTVEWDWGPLMVKAFPDGHRAPLTQAQRTFLRAALEHDDDWGNTAGRIIWLRKAGLPSEREALCELL